ncbi:MAG: MAPEG family protein [Gammaproteobacteria bacterium]
MELVAIVTALALIQYLLIGMLVGRARVRGGVQAPATSGDPIFERYFRAHQNTLEQLILFVPSLWIFAYYVSAQVAAALGLVFIIGRLIFVRAYVVDPPTRATGFLIGIVPLMVLLIGSLLGPLIAWL